MVIIFIYIQSQNDDQMRLGEEETYKIGMKKDRFGSGERNGGYRCMSTRPPTGLQTNNTNAIGTVPLDILMKKMRSLSETAEMRFVPFI